MAYIAPVHRPSSVRHALHMKLLSPTEESIVIARANRIEIWRITDDSLMTLYHSQMIFGTISMLQVLRPIDSETEMLFVGTDRFEYFSLDWDTEAHRLQTVDTFQDVGEKHLRDTQSQDRCLVDPSGRFMALLLWEGVLTVLRLQTRRDRARPDQTRHLVPMEQVRLSELFIKTCAFLHSDTGQPKIAFLYQSLTDRAESRLASYRLTAGDRNAETGRFDPHKDRELDRVLDDTGATLLIPVEKADAKRHNMRNTASATANLGGLLVVGETQVLYIDDTTQQTVQVPLRTASIFVTWARYDPTHYLLGDEYGMLHLLTIIPVQEGSAVVDRLDVSPLGRTSRASSLVYLPERQLLFVGSHYGDSQLFHVELTRTKAHLHELQVLPSIAPILDFVVMDMGNREDGQQLANEYASGQARLVTGSGIFQDGRLCSVRSGVGLEELGVLGDMDGVRGVFSLRSPRAPEGRVDTLVVSFLTETRVFLFSPDGEIEEAETFPGLDLNVQTLAAANVDSDQVLQITPTAVTLSESGDGGIGLAAWSPATGASITSASANSQWVLVSVDGTELVSLSIAGGLAVAAQKTMDVADQIACVHAAPQLTDVGVVGLWSSGTVSVVDLKTLEPRQSGMSLRRREDRASVPRGLALAQVLPVRVGGPTLLVAMDDGSVVTFDVSTDGQTLSGRKSVVLGTRQARLHMLPQADGATYSIFATTEHPSLIYGSEGRITYAAVTAEDAQFVCGFDTAAFPGAVVVATATQIRLARPDTTKQTHVRSMAVGETVRRLAHSAAEGVFALGCVRRELVQGREVVTSTLRLVDEVVFQPVGRTLALGTTESCINNQTEDTEIVECLVRAELVDSRGQPAERFLVGTSISIDGAATAAATSDVVGSVADGKPLGRLLVVGLDSEHNPYVVSAHRLRGPCRAIGILDDGVIAIGMSKTVVLGRYTEISTMSGLLRRVAAYRTSTYVVDLAVDGRLIAVADMMKSTAVLEYVPAAAEGSEMEGVAGDEAGGNTGNAGNAGNAGEAQLVERARSYEASWATAVGHVEGDSWLEADGSGNLSVVARNADGVTDEDRRRLRVTSDMSLGEMVNRIRPIRVAASAGALVHPRAFLGTIEGSIYMFGTIAPDRQELLMALQAKLAAIVKGPGNTTFSAYRGLRSPERESAEPFRFVDGELIERFLEFGEDVQEEIVQGLGPSVEDLRNMVEELKQMH